MHWRAARRRHTFERLRTDPRRRSSLPARVVRLRPASTSRNSAATRRRCVRHEAIAARIRRSRPSDHRCVALRHYRRLIACVHFLILLRRRSLPIRRPRRRRSRLGTVAASAAPDRNQSRERAVAYRQLSERRTRLRVGSGESSRRAGGVAADVQSAGARHSDDRSGHAFGNPPDHGSRLERHARRRHGDRARRQSSALTPRVDSGKSRRAAQGHSGTRPLPKPLTTVSRRSQNRFESRSDPAHDFFDQFAAIAPIRRAAISSASRSASTTIDRSQRSRCARHDLSVHAHRQCDTAFTVCTESVATAFARSDGPSRNGIGPQSSDARSMLDLLRTTRASCGTPNSDRRDNRLTDSQPLTAACRCVSAGNPRCGVPINP